MKKNIIMCGSALICLISFLVGFLIVHYNYEQNDKNTDYSIEAYEYFFNQGAISKETLGPGWSQIEKWGVWSDKKVASLSLPIKNTPIKEISFNFVIQVFNGGPNSQDISVYVNDHHAATWVYPAKRNLHKRRLDYAPPQKFSLDRLKVTFKISNPLSPKELGMSSDARKLGIGLREISFITKGLDPYSIVQ